MFIVETEDGKRIECANDKELKREMRKAAKAEQKAMADRERKSKIANTESKLNAYKLLDRFVDGAPAPHGWRFLTPDKMFRKPTPSANCFGKVSHSCKYETEGGSASFEHYGFLVSGIIENGAGFAMAVLLKDNQGGPDQFVSIGIHEDVVALTHLPDVLIPNYCVEKKKD